MTANVNIDLSRNVGISLAIAAASGFVAGYVTSRCLSWSVRASDATGSPLTVKADDASESETPRSTTPSSTTERYIENGNHGNAGANKQSPDVGSALKMVLLVRDDLLLSPGTIAKHCSTACLGQFKKLWKIKSEELREWEVTGMKKVCLQIADEEELISVQSAARSKGIPTRTVVDEGNRRTVLAIGPARSDVLESMVSRLKDM